MGFKVAGASNWLKETFDFKREGSGTERLRYLYHCQFHLEFPKREELIREVVEQEVLSRQNASFQGFGVALRLGCYLLSQYRNPADIPLFFEAKFANFDTVCGFDSEFIFVALADQTQEYLEAKHPEILEKLVARCGKAIGAPENGVEDFLASYSRWFPSDPGTMTDWAWYQLFTDIDEVELAKHHFEAWLKDAPDNEATWKSAKRALEEQNDYKRALLYAQRIEAQKTDLWDICSELRDVLKLQVENRDWREASETVSRLASHMDTFDGWHNIGLGRMIIHQAFRLASQTPREKIARYAIETAMGWMEHCDVAFNTLKESVAAAEKWAPELVKKLSSLLVAEAKRIEAR